MELLLKYFPEMTSLQMEQFAALQQLYSEWNEKINVISRKDIGNLYERHVLHSLTVAKFVQFHDATKIMDLGTGGGFPGVPLAILFPASRFHLVDSIAKKLKVIDAVKDAIQLKNVFTFHSRSEEMDFQYDFVVSRAVAPLSALVNWTKGKYLSRKLNTVSNGLICLKGGYIDSEMEVVRNARKVPISKFYSESFFNDKFLVHVPL
jgi:16S rRNA (guanine527-N7)-methyltransferase